MSLCEFYLRGETDVSMSLLRIPSEQGDIDTSVS